MCSKQGYFIHIKKEPHLVTLLYMVIYDHI